MTRGRITLLLGLLFPAAVLPYATVHDGPRAAIGLACALAGAAGLLAGTRKHRPPRLVAAAWGLAAAALTAGAAAFLPLGPRGRALLQPGLAEAIEAGLHLGGRERHMLALDPWGASTGWVFAAQVALLALGCASVARGLRRARRLAGVMIATGCALVLLAWVQWASGAASIWWVSGVPAEAKDPFFGTFVNPNQGGGVCAALVPLALSFTTRGHSQSRVLAGGAAALLSAGALSAGSRGAVLEWAAGCAVFGLLLGAPRLRRLTLGLSAAAGLIFVALDPTQVALRLSRWVAPGSVWDDPYTGRREIWADSLRLIADAPLLGVGTGSYSEAYKLVKSSPLFASNTHAHNDLLQALVEHGLIGGPLWIAAALLPAALATRRCLRLEPGRRRTVLAGYLGAAGALLTAACFTFPARIGAMAVLSALVSGVLLRLAARGEDPHRASPGATRVLTASALGLAALTAAASPALRAPALRDRLDADRALDAGDAAWRYARGGGGEDAAAALAAAEGWYREALAIRPLEHRAMLRLARLAIARGDREGAIALLRTAARTYPTLPFPWLNLARLYTAAGDLPAARAAWRELLATDLPDEDTAAAYLSEALEGAGGEDLSAVLDQLLPDRPDRLRQAAGLLSRRGERALAERLFQRNLALDPQAVVAYAGHLLQWRRPREALALLEGAELEEGCYALRVAGGAHMKIGELERALASFERAMDACGSDDPKARIGLAQARLAAGSEGAVDFAEQLLGDYPEAHGLRRSLLAALRGTHRDALVRDNLEQLVLAGVATREESEELSALLRE